MQLIGKFIKVGLYVPIARMYYNNYATTSHDVYNTFLTHLVVQLQPLWTRL